MIRRALLLASLLLCCISTWADPKWKSVAECDAEWNAWADRAMPNYRSISQDYETLNRKYGESQREIERLESSLSGAQDMRITVFLGTLGLGIGAVAAFYTVRFLRRVRPFTAQRKQLIVLIVAALWVSAAGWIAINDDTLSKHPVNMLFTVLVYSIPALAFGGIGFWWFGRAAEKGQAAHG
jgi:hypothetical protein